MKLPANTAKFRETKHTRLVQVVGKRKRDESISGTPLANDVFVHVGSSRPSPADFVWKANGAITRAKSAGLDHAEAALESVGSSLGDLFGGEDARTYAATAVFTDAGELAVAAGHADVLIIDAKKKKVVRRLGGHDPGEYGWLQIAKAPSGELVVLDDAGRLRVWDAKTAKCKHTLGPTPGRYALPSFSDDGARALVTTATRGAVGHDTVTLWDAKSWRPKREVFVVKKNAYLQAVSFLGSFVAVATTESLVRLFDAKTLDVVDTLDMRAAKDPIAQLLLLPQGDRFLAFGNNGQFYVFDLRA